MKEKQRSFVSLDDQEEIVRALLRLAEAHPGANLLDKAEEMCHAVATVRNYDRLLEKRGWFAQEETKEGVFVQALKLDFSGLNLFEPRLLELVAQFGCHKLLEVVGDFIDIRLAENVPAAGADTANQGVQTVAVASIDVESLSAALRAGKGK
ncbi:hypothetical protein A7P96_05010 [Eikenella sp. NML03-A-027]|uniref:hypothetical protein n=1 Tax=Eikenella sp. NML03-A-027 TaxID=1795828 RepID=UPI0007DFD15A|nr:hypothetical protein [Eikenella sp. NML03-A-027]OAM31646.1 hypothetical protein A7P96_05010 [Eikenella sp. NML03-A-027]